MGTTAEPLRRWRLSDAISRSAAHAVDVNQVDVEVLAEADRRRSVAATRLSEDSRRSLSQFFTPAATARRLAGLIDLSSMGGNGSLRVLFPSAGTGMLPAAVAEAVLGHGGAASGLRFVCVEIDGRLMCPLEATLADVRAVLLGSVTEAVHADFVDLAASWLQPRVGDFETSASAVVGDGFDLVVMNPPYAKLGRRSPAAVAFRSVGVQVPNLYAGFVQAAMMMLRPGGQLVAVTPRSFVNGAYFRDFRRAMLALGGVADVVVPESRTEAFADDGVLQEIVMFRMVAGERPVTVRVERDRPGRGTVACSYPTEVIVNPADRQQRIVTPHSPAEAAFRATASAKLSTVAEIGVTAAAGKTVPHRVQTHLRYSSHDGLPTATTAPSGDLLDTACDLFGGPSPRPAVVPLLRTAHLRGGGSSSLACVQRRRRCGRRICPWRRSCPRFRCSGPACRHSGHRRDAVAGYIVRSDETHQLPRGPIPHRRRCTDA